MAYKITHTEWVCTLVIEKYTGKHCITWGNYPKEKSQESHTGAK